MSEQRGWPYEPVDTAVLPAPTAEQPVFFSVADPAAEPPPTPVPASSTRPIALLGLVVLVTVAVLLGAFAVFDWLSRNHELDALLDRIERAEVAQRHDALDPLMRDCYLSAGECDVSAIERLAVRALPDLRAAGQDVAGMRLLRHHRALRELRDRYVEHNLAWQSWYSSLATGDGDLDAPNAIRTTWANVGEAAHRAIPPLPLHGAHARVSRMFDT